jgi:hypothetical protein
VHTSHLKSILIRQITTDVTDAGIVGTQESLRSVAVLIPIYNSIKPLALAASLAHL